MNEYEKQATDFLSKYSLAVLVENPHDAKFPFWAGETERIGTHYLVTLHRLDERGYSLNSLTFDYWGSYSDKEAGRKPTDYDILSCLSSDINMPTDPDYVYEEMGPMKPSQCTAVAKFAQDLQDFFTEEEQADLAEIC